MFKKIQFLKYIRSKIQFKKISFKILQEFLLAIDVTSSGSPEEKLNWAFSMYDVDGNGWIDLPEMTKIGILSLLILFKIYA